MAALVSLIATAAFFCEYLLPPHRVHLFSDIEVYHHSLQRYALQSLKQGHFPQWDSIYCGITFAGNLQAALFYPPNWILYAATWGQPAMPYKPLEYFVFAHVWLAFLLCYLWLRARHLDWLPSALGACVFAYGGYLMWQIVHVGVATALPWMPLALWGIDDATERNDWRPLWKTALASAFWCLAGYPPSWLAFCVAVMVYAIAGRGRWRVAAGTAAAIAGSLLLSAAQLLPTLEARSSMYAETRYTGQERSAIIPLFVANWRDYNRSSPISYLDAMYLYWGVAAVFAILWAVRRGHLRPYVQPLAVLIVCLYLVLDPGHHVYWTMLSIPPLEKVAQSYNFYEGAAAMAALVTGLAIADFLKRVGRPVPRWIMPAAALLMMAWSARQLRIWAHGGEFASGAAAAGETAVALGLFAVAVWIVRAESGPRRAAMAAAMLLFLLCDYKVYGTNRMFNTRDGDVDEMLPVGGIHGVSPEAYGVLWNNRHFRVTTDGAPSSLDLRMFGFYTPQGLDPFLPTRYREMVRPWVQFETSRIFRMDYRNERLLQLLGVRYAISYQGAPGEPVLSASPSFRRIGPDSFYRVYEYLQARPPFGWDGVPGDARPIEWRAERRAFRTGSPVGGRFGLTEQFFPGWTATVDGRPVPVERWRDLFQSVAVPAGEHAVVFEYHSRFLPAGAAISLVAFAGLCWIAFSGRGTPVVGLSQIDPTSSSI